MTLIAIAGVDLYLCYFNHNDMNRFKIISGMDRNECHLFISILHYVN